MNHSEKKRPAFHIAGSNYVSAGVLIYTMSYPTIFFLMQHVTDKRWDDTSPNWKWEDFGGKSEPADEDIQQVAFRECSEETNGIISYDFLEKSQKDPRSFSIRVPECKYMLYVIYVDPSKLQEWSQQPQKQEQKEQQVLQASSNDSDQLDLPIVHEPVQCNIFGSTETHTGVNRIIKWITYADLLHIYQTRKLHPRVVPVIDSLITRIAMTCQSS